MKFIHAWIVLSAVTMPFAAPGQIQPEDRRDRIYYPGDTEKILPLAGKLVRNTLLDQKEIWTSPFHSKQYVAEWVGFGAVTASLIATDRRTSHIFEDSQGQVNWGNHVSSVGSPYTLLPEAAGFYVYGLLADNRKSRETGVLGGEALLDSLIVVEVLKLAAGRDRPNASAHPGDFFKGGQSFPSGHSIASFALASVIAHEYRNRRWIPYVAYGLATAVGASRYAARQHYASDISAGRRHGLFHRKFRVQYTPGPRRASSWRDFEGAGYSGLRRLPRSHGSGGVGVEDVSQAGVATDGDCASGGRRVISRPSE